MNHFYRYLGIGFLTFMIGIGFTISYLYQSDSVSKQVTEQFQRQSSKAHPPINEIQGISPPKPIFLTDKERVNLLYKITVDNWLNGEKLNKVIEPTTEIIQKIKQRHLHHFEEKYLLNCANRSYETILIDLNNDGKNELIIKTESDLYQQFFFYILKKRENSFDVILSYDFYEKFKLLKSKNKGHFDIETSSKYNPNEYSISKDVFKFDGKKYYHYGCFVYSERYLNNDGKWIKLKKPTTEKLDDCC